MKKTNRAILLSVICAFLLTITLVTLFESAANSPVMQHNLQPPRHVYEVSDSTDNDSQGAQDDESSAAESGQNLSEADNQASPDEPASDDRGNDAPTEAALRLQEREVEPVLYISRTLFDDVDIYVWRELQRLSGSFDIVFFPLDDVRDAEWEAEEIRNAIIAGFSVILINPTYPESIAEAIREAYEAGVVVGTIGTDLPVETRGYRHFFIPFIGNSSGRLYFPESAEDARVQTDLNRMALNALRSMRSVLDFGYVNPSLVMMG